MIDVCDPNIVEAGSISWLEFNSLGGVGDSIYCKCGASLDDRVEQLSLSATKGALGVQFLPFLFSDNFIFCSSSRLTIDQVRDATRNDMIR